MEHKAAQHTSETERKPLGPTDADDIGVSASELIELIRSGEHGDFNELVRQTLQARQAA